MKKTLWDLIKLLIPLNSGKQKALTMAAQYLTEQDVTILKQYLKLDRAFATIQQFNTSLVQEKGWPFFKSHRQEQEVNSFLERINKDIVEKAKHETFLAFAPNALEKITANIAPNIIGMNEQKKLAAIQLFAKEPFHILLVGDPATGKTDILRSIHTLAPISSFGLGSGTSSAGLSAAAKGNDIIKGLLPLADNGIACIDELNLMKAKDMASLYNAMEKGFITYDKGTKHEQLSAKVRIYATANPVHKSFIGRSAETLKKQLPFDDALLSRFHYIFIARKPNEKEFAQITRKIVSGGSKKEKHLEPSLAPQTTNTADTTNDVSATNRLTNDLSTIDNSAASNTPLTKDDIAFLKEYITYAENVAVDIDIHLQERIVSFIGDIKLDEKQFFVDVGPRTVVGLVRLVKATARAELLQAVDENHVKEACLLLRKSLYVRKEDSSS